jgi:hypothetical protein
MPRKKKLSDKQYELIRNLAIIRLPRHMMATSLNMSKSMFDTLAKKDARMRQVLEDGNATASKNVRKTLYAMAVGHREIVEKTVTAEGLITTKIIQTEVPADFQALRYWCDTQEGFKKTEKFEITGSDGGPIEVGAPDPVKLAKRLKQLREINALDESDSNGEEE